MEMEQTKHAEMNSIVEKMILALMPEEDQDDEEKREAARDAYEFVQNRQNNKARVSSDYMRGELICITFSCQITFHVDQLI